MGALCSKPNSGIETASSQPSRRDEASKPATALVPEQEDEMKEFTVDKVDLGENEMKVVELDGETEVLLVKTNGKLHAVGTKCPHYGAPLVKGTACNGNVRCPWHGACFSLETGDVEDFPSIDGIPRFQLKESKDHLVIRGKKEEFRTKRATAHMAKCEQGNKETVVIIGGGGAGFSCAYTLRKEGFTGRVVLITKESHLPYDRPKLSKAMTIKAEEIALKPAEYFKEADIEIVMSVEAVGVDHKEKLVSLSNGETLKYTTLVVAVGGRPRDLTVPGHDLKNIFHLRSPEDANQIAGAAKGQHVVIYGAGFIGMETASFLVPNAASVTVIGRDTVPLRRVLGEKIGRRLREMHEEKGVKFKFGATITECHGEDGTLKEVLLSDGTLLQADVLLLGLGVVPATEFLRNVGLDQDRDGNVLVNEFLQTSDENIYAAGDIANFPLRLLPDSTPQRTTVGHWSMALAHGRNVALNILGKKRAVKTVPFFWTVMFGKSIRFAGHAPDFDDVIIHGNLEQLTFVAYFCEKDRVMAVATLNSDPAAAAFADSLSAGIVTLKSEIAEATPSF